MTPINRPFVTWTHSGIRYLAIETGSDFHIIDETGGWYGGWHSVEHFRKRQKEGRDDSLPARATLAVHTHPN